MSNQLEPAEVERLLRALPLAKAPDSLWSDVRGELDAPRHTLAGRVFRRPIRSPWLAAAAAVLTLVGATYAGVLRTYAAPSAWSVVSLTGTPTVAGAPVSDRDGLRAGEWLATDSSSSARLDIGNIGSARIGPGSRVRLDRGGLTAHRLTLERGSLSAVVTAPPRLFAVATPATLATDLGCAYTMEVDSAGATRVHVTAGWVELRSTGIVSLVPAGQVAEVTVGKIPGTPYPAGLSSGARDALHRLDAGTGTVGDLQLVLDEQYRPSDFVTLRRQSAVTLWHLTQRVNAGLRPLVYDRLVALAPPPSGVTREGILGLDRRMLERWRRELSPMWADEAQSWATRFGRRVLEWTLR
jgi:hypothetical protein